MARFIMGSLAAGILSIVAAAGAGAEEFPAHAITMVVSTSAGGTPDLVGRLMATEMSKLLGQPFVVENKTGANSTIGYGYVAQQAPADGYTIALVQVQELANLPWVVKDLRFDPLKDLRPFIGLVQGRLVLLTPPQAPWKTFDDMVAQVRANPGKFNWGSTSSTALFPVLAVLHDQNLQMTLVPFSSASAYQSSMMGNEIQLGITGGTAAVALGSKIRIIATTGAKRSPAFPDAPTFIELGMPEIVGNSFSLNVPAGVPKQAFDRLHDAAAKALAGPDVKARFVAAGLDIVELSPDEAAKELAENGVISANIAKQAGIKPN